MTTTTTAPSLSVPSLMSSLTTTAAPSLSVPSLMSSLTTTMAGRR